MIMMKFKKYIWLILCSTVLLVAGCGVTEREYKYECTSFTTNWVASAYIDDGMIWWKESTKDRYSKSYKIPYNDICTKKRRNVAGN